MKSVVSDDSSSTREHQTIDIVQPAEGPPAGHSSPSTPPAEATLLESDATQLTLPALQVVPPGTPLIGPVSASQLLPTPLDMQRDPTVISQRPIAAPAEFMRSLSLVELSRSLEGRQLDHFAVDRMIGGGGMGAVFRGRDLRLDRDVAIKVIPESRRDPETLRRFRMEAQSAARLDHPNIARVYDIGEDEVWNYIVFEFIDGINLRDLVQLDGPMSIDDAVFTTRQVAEALQHAHDRDVVHRDIKPSNVIITPTGIAKVVDMGLARNTAMDRSTADQTASGVTLGTFDYISPEQARDPRDADVRSDLYSLGCTLFYMLTGQPPFPDGTALQKLLNHGSQPHPDPRQWRDDISDQLVAVLAKLMAKRPADRYQKPLELINDLMLIAQLESLPRSRSAGTILLRPTVAQRSLVELHLPWVLPLCVLMASVFWLQSAESLTAPLELPQPSFQPALRQTDQPNRNSGSTERSITLPTTETRSAPIVNPSNAGPSTPVSGVAPSEVTTNAAVPVTNGTMLNGPMKSVTDGRSRGAPFLLEASKKPDSVGVLSPDNYPASAASGPNAYKLTAEGLRASEVETLTNLRQHTESSRPPTRERDSNVGAPNLSGAALDLSGTALDLSGTALGPTLTSPQATQPSGGNANSGSLSAIDPKSGDAPLGRTPADETPRTAGNRQPGEPLRVISNDIILVSQSEPSDPQERGQWAESLSAALARAAMLPGVRIIELRESIELRQALTIPRTGLTLRAAPGTAVEIVLTGSQAYGMGWESWFEIQRQSLRCEGLHFICRNDMRQPQAIFALRAGGKVELQDCSVTMVNSRDTSPGVCVLISEPERLREPVGGSPAGAVTSDLPAASEVTSLPEREPTSVSIRNCVVRGHQTLVGMRTACRAEITLEESCMMLEGRVLTIRGLEQDRMPPVVRMGLDQSTFICRQGFAAVQTTYASRAPLTLMRTAKLCAFWSPSTVPHITIDGIATEEVLDELLQLRGEENAYDQNVETLCQCRFADGKHVDFSFRDATGEWFRERGNDNSLRWLNTVPPDRALEEQLPADYRLRAGMFIPGYPPGLDRTLDNALLPR